jgi:hypothetical protein
MTELERVLYDALVAALDQLEGEPRLVAMAAIEKAEREPPVSKYSEHVVRICQQNQ